MDGSVFDATDMLLLFGNTSTTDPALPAYKSGAFALQEQRSLLGSLDVFPTSDTGDVACQGSLNTQTIVTLGSAAALALAKKWLVTVPLDADGRVWDSSGQQYHQKNQGAWESAAEWLIMARLVAAHGGGLGIFDTATDRVLCYEEAGGALVNAGGETAGGDAVCKLSVGDLEAGTVPTLGDVFREAYTGEPSTTRDIPRLQIAGVKRLVQRFTVPPQPQEPSVGADAHALTALRVPLVGARGGNTYPATLCLKHVASGRVVFNTTLWSGNSSAAATTTGSPEDDGWLRVPLGDGTALPTGAYDLAVTAARVSRTVRHSNPSPAAWLTRTAALGGGGRLESWGYVHAPAANGSSGTSPDDNSCCAQSSSPGAGNNTLAAKLERGMLWQLSLSRKSSPHSAASPAYGMLVVPDAFYNGVPVTGLGTCSASSMWDQVRMGWKATYINMLFLKSIDAWGELEDAGVVSPMPDLLRAAGYPAITAADLRGQVAEDIVRQVGYESGSDSKSKSKSKSGGSARPAGSDSAASQGPLGFYSWIFCNRTNGSTGLSACDRDAPPAQGDGQRAIDAQMLPDQIYAVMLGVGNRTATRSRLDAMLAESRSGGSGPRFVHRRRQAPGGGMVRNNLVPLEAIDPRIVSSADKWDPITAEGFCAPAANGSMAYSGHCVCANTSLVGGTVCYGNFGNNQQNGGRMMSTQASLFFSGPYTQAFADFRAIVTDLRAIAAQLRAKDYSHPLLTNDPGFLRSPIPTDALRRMCLEGKDANQQERDAFGKIACDFNKDITFGLRTGPKIMLLGFAMGHLGLHVAASGRLSLFGQAVDLPQGGAAAVTADTVTLNVTLPPEDAARWPPDLRGLALAGVNVGGQGQKATVACNITRPSRVTTLACSVIYTASGHL